MIQVKGKTKILILSGMLLLGYGVRCSISLSANVLCYLGFTND